MTESSAPLLACESVDFAYDHRAVLTGVDLRIGRGEVVGVIGPNGVGKSTLLHLLAGTLVPQRGEVRLDGQPLRGAAPEALARRLAVVPQATPMVFGHRVVDIVAMGRHPHRDLFQWRLSHEDEERVLGALEQTGMTALATRRFNELSGGEQQLVFIARALAQSTEIMLLDEPTASLDLHHQAAILDILRDLHRAQGTTLVWVAHDLNLVSRLCQRLVLLDAGRVTADGPPDEILTAERLSEVYQTAVSVEVAADGRRRVDLAFSNGGSVRR